MTRVRADSPVVLAGHDERAADDLVTDKRAAGGLELNLIADVFRLQKIQGFVLGFRRCDF